MRAVLIGAVESSRVALECIAQAAGWSLQLVVTLPQDKSLRHSDFVDLTRFAEEAGCEIRQFADVNSKEAILAIEQASPDYVFVVGWSQICGASFRAACRDRVIGYHPTPLPRLRGRAVIPWTILNDEPISAGTLFWIDDGVDSGPILAQRFFHVAPDETAASLYRKHMDVLRLLMAEALHELESPSPSRVPQDDRYATWAARRTPADGFVDWARPGGEIERLIRAVGGPYPPAYTFEGEYLIEIHSARLKDHEARLVASAGQVVSSTAAEFSVKCGDGAVLTVTSWSHAGQRQPKLHSVLNGRPPPVLSKVEDSALPAMARELKPELPHV